MNNNKPKSPQEIVRNYLSSVAPDRLRPPRENLVHPYVDPGAGYENILWDWDAYFCLLGMESMATGYKRIGWHARGCVDNFLDHQGSDGHVPYAITPGRPVSKDKIRPPESEKNPAKPLLAQFALLANRCGGGDREWLINILPKLEKSLHHWFSTQSSYLGLLTWRSHRGSGADNHPAYFQRPHNSVADPFLNAMMVQECRALAEICRESGHPWQPWEKRAMDLADAIERWMWDPIDGTYYCIDLGRGDPGKVNTPADWSVPLKFRTFGMVMPLWAGIASPERARRIVHEHLQPTDQLRSPHGIRSLARVEPAYRIFANFNPSDWLGPVWVVSTYLAWEALRRYHFTEEAAKLANDHIAMLARDIETNGCLHEYFHPETGEGMTHPGFINWNTCALRMIP